MTEEYKNYKFTAKGTYTSLSGSYIVEETNGQESHFRDYTGGMISKGDVVEYLDCESYRPKTIMVNGDVILSHNSHAIYLHRHPNQVKE